MANQESSISNHEEQSAIVSSEMNAKEPFPTKVIAKPKIPSIFKLVFWGLIFGLAIVVLVIMSKGGVNFKVKNDTFSNPLKTPSGQEMTATQASQINQPSILTQGCVNKYYGYSLQYPLTWFTTQRNEQERCQYFAPAVFSFPKTIEGQLTPIELKLVSPDDWEQTKEAVASSSASWRITSSQEVQLAENNALRIEAEGREGDSERGVVIVSYLIDHPKNPIVARLRVDSGGDSEGSVTDYIKIFDSMIKSLRFI